MQPFILILQVLYAGITITLSTLIFSLSPWDLLVVLALKLLCTTLPTTPSPSILISTSTNALITVTTTHNIRRPTLARSLSPEQLLNILQVQTSSLGDQEIDKQPGDDQDSGVEPERARSGDPLGQRQECE